MIHKNIIWSLLTVSSVGIAQAQSSFDHIKLTDVGLASSNASLLVTNDVQNLGESNIYFNSTNGKFKHPLVADQSNFGGFATERYQRINNWKLYGKFDLSFGKDKDVNHTTQLNPLRLNPYIIADSLAGDWNKQYYNLEGKISSPIVRDQFVFGIGLKYNVSTGARQRDPRPLNTSNSVTLTPSMTYLINEINAIGINGMYGRFVEDFSLENENTNTVHNLYKLIGVGEYIGSSPFFISTGSLARTYTGNQYGGAMQYVYKGEGARLFIEGFLQANKENATDGTTYPQAAGQHAYLNYGFNVESTFGSLDRLHTVKTSWNQYNIENTEFHQYQDATTREYITLFSEKFNTNLVTNSSLDYAFVKRSNEELNWVFGAGVSYMGWDNKYALNQSQQTVDRLTYKIDFRRYFNFNNSSALKVKLEPTFSKALDSEFAYDEKSYSSNFVANNILYPTNAYLSADYFGLAASVQYNFKKSTKNNTQMYIKLAENYTKQTSDNASLYFNSSSDRIVWQVSLGLLTF